MSVSDPDFAATDTTPVPARRGWFAGVAEELRAVTWPSRRAVGRYTATVLVFATATVAAIGGLDTAVTAAILKLFG